VGEIVLNSAQIQNQNMLSDLKTEQTEAKQSKKGHKKKADRKRQIGDTCNSLIIFFFSRERKRGASHFIEQENGYLQA
jgi:hypothetical protein